jgi:hypothetical protein
MSDKMYQCNFCGGPVKIVNLKSSDLENIVLEKSEYLEEKQLMLPVIDFKNYNKDNKFTPCAYCGNTIQILKE